LSLVYTSVFALRQHLPNLIALSMSLSICRIVSPFGMHIVWHSTHHKSMGSRQYVNWRKQMLCNIYTYPCTLLNIT